MNACFRQVLFKLLEYFNLPALKLVFVFFQDLFKNSMYRVRLLDGGIDLDIVQKTVENGINFLNVFGDDSIKILLELCIIKLFLQELRKGFNGHERILD